MKKYITQQEVMIAARVYNCSPSEESLEALLNTIKEFYIPAPDNRCSWCGKTDSENSEDGFGSCLDISVEIASGEEGWAKEFRWMCNDHLIEIPMALIDLGFNSHRHGGINFLEDHNCPGYNHRDDCPTPEEDEYGF